MINRCLEGWCLSCQWRYSTNLASAYVDGIEINTPPTRLPRRPHHNLHNHHRLPRPIQLEEKLSTFDYPMRTKSIRNNFEPHNALLKEYAAEVYRLKADVLAMWEKNVFFFLGRCEHQTGPEADGVGGSVDACGPG